MKEPIAATSGIKYGSSEALSGHAHMQEHHFRSGTIAVRKAQITDLII